jgi:hypothetical protein
MKVSMNVMCGKHTIPRPHKVDALLQYLKEYKYIFLRASVSGKSVLIKHVQKHLHYDLKLPFADVRLRNGEVQFQSNLPGDTWEDVLKRGENEPIVVFIDDAFYTFGDV